MPDPVFYDFLTPAKKKQIQKNRASMIVVYFLFVGLVKIGSCTQHQPALKAGPARAVDRLMNGSLWHRKHCLFNLMK